jgi:hypothetical protein
VAKTVLLSGFDLWAPELPEDVRLLQPPFPLPAVDDVRQAALRALEEPEGGQPLSALVRPTSRVAVVLDDFSLPVPPVVHDCRREMLESVLQVLHISGVRSSRVGFLVANGLSRQWRAGELDEFLGSPRAHPVRCHDAEDFAQLVRIGEEPEGPVELNRALVESDLIVYLNIVAAPLMSGLFGLIAGTAGYRTARFLGAPTLFAHDANPLLPGSEYDRIHQRVAGHLLRRTPVLQLAAVMNTELWRPAMAALLRSDEGLSRPLQVWNALPGAVRYRAGRFLKASYRPIAVLAGAPERVRARALDAFYRQHEVSLEREADILVFGLPDVGPASVHSSQNPVLAANLALGYVSNFFAGKPFLRAGGAIVFANPLHPVFDRRTHLPHEEFYEKVLRLERDPLAIHERFEPYFAGRPEFVSNYQKRFSFHGTHPLYAWYLCTPARSRAGKIWVAHADPRACARLGFTPAKDVEDALAKAREFVGGARPFTVVLQLPPPYWVRVR